MNRLLTSALFGAILAVGVAGCKERGPTVRNPREGAAPAAKPVTPIKVGEKARDFTLPTSGGGTFRLASLEGKKVVVLGIGNPYG